MRIPREMYEQMIEHAREEAPNECCGLVAVKVAQVSLNRSGCMVIAHRALAEHQKDWRQLYGFR